MLEHARIDKSVRELAALTGGEAEGDLEHKITGAAELDVAGPEHASFLGNAKYGKVAAVSKTGCLFLPRAGRSLAAGVLCKNRVWVDDPQWAFAQVLQLIEAAESKPVPVVIHEKALIHYQAKLGPEVSVGAFTVIERGAGIAEGTIIGPQCYIGENVKIGRGCRLYPQVVVREGCVIGDRVTIHSGTVIGADGFGFTPDLKTGRHRKIPQIGNVVIKDDVEIGSNVTIDRATVDSTVVGAGTKIDNLVQVAHNVQIGQGCFIVSQVGIAGSTKVGDFVILAGQVGLAGHLKIGAGAQIGAQSGVMADVEKGTKMFGFPARAHREAFKLQALYGRLPELFEAVKAVQEKLGIKSKESTEASS